MSDDSLLRQLSGLLDTDIVLVDVGSRNGVTELPALAAFIHAFGFEPSMEEFEKLQRGETDLDRAGHGARTRCKREQYFPYALTGRAGTCPLYITRGIGASSTLQPDAATVARFRRDNWSAKFDVVRVESVPARTLSGFLADAGISQIDYLKLDTQGNEYDILADQDVLDRVSVIKTEVEFLPLYRDQKLYHDVAGLLHARGFEQIDLRFEPVHYRGLNPEGLPGGPLVWADAYFVNTAARTREIHLRQAIVLLGLEKDDLALELVRRNDALPDEAFFALRSAFSAFREGRLTMRQRVKRWVERRLGLRVNRIAAGKS